MASPKIRSLKKKHQPSPESTVQSNSTGLGKRSHATNQKQPLNKPQQKNEAPTLLDKKFSNASTTFFQAIGVIKGEVSFYKKNQLTIALDGQEYPLKASHRLQKNFRHLKNYVESTGTTTQKLIVYPRVTHYPQKDKPYQISFQLLGKDDDWQQGVASFLEDREFILHGLWQFIPVCPIPCLSIFKNRTPQNLEIIEQLDPLRRFKFLQACHIPLLWDNPSVKPFQNGSRDLDSPKFVQLKAQFIPLKNVFEFQELTVSPQAEAPDFLKDTKEDKEAASKVIMEKAQGSKLRQKEANSEQTAQKQHENKTERSLESKLFSINTDGEGLTATALAERFGVSNSTVGQQSKKGKEPFANWSRNKDPEGIAWERREQTSTNDHGKSKPRYFPLSN